MRSDPVLRQGALRRGLTGSVAALALVLASCGGGSSGGGSGGGSAPVTPGPAAGTPGPASVGLSYPAFAQDALTVAEVQRIIAQAVGEAQARNLPSTIAVVDRVGNVLGVFEMNGAPQTGFTSRETPVGRNEPRVDIQGEEVPSTSAAITKAITAAYLSSGGNAFTPRTASAIVQQHFPPAPTAAGFESGPLFGVQFSSLPCSDLMARLGDAGTSTYRSPLTGTNVSGGGMIGPKRSPLGLAADAGGLPLYKNGVLVGGVGVFGDRDYGFDPDVLDIDEDAEEFIALAGTVGFAAPQEIRANRIPVDGSTLRFSDAIEAGLNPIVQDFAFFNGTAGQVVPVRGYFDGTIRAGVPFGTEASGIRRARADEFSIADAHILSDGSGNARYPIRGGTDGGSVSRPLTAAETRTILEEAYVVMSRARGQIRRPLDSQAHVTVSVVDTNGAILGIVRAPDAPVFGTDVSLQKARTAMFFSHPQAGVQLAASPDVGVPAFVTRAREFLGPDALTGRIAFSDRANGNLSRPYYPDGQVGQGPGPFSRPIEDFNPFATGLQIALVRQNIIQNALFVLAVSAIDVESRCTRLPDAVPGQNRLQNGIQIFPGSVPIYRGDTLVGGIGISGDGIDQDDMVSFLGLHRAGVRLGGSIGNAPKGIRADTVIPPGGPGTRLRWVTCPFKPFLDSEEQNVCEGL